MPKVLSSKEVNVGITHIMERKYNTNKPFRKDDKRIRVMMQCIRLVYFNGKERTLVKPGHF